MPFPAQRVGSVTRRYSGAAGGLGWAGRVEATREGEEYTRSSNRCILFIDRRAPVRSANILLSLFHSLSSCALCATLDTHKSGYLSSFSFWPVLRRAAPSATACSTVSLLAPATVTHASARVNRVGACTLQKCQHPKASGLRGLAQGKCTCTGATHARTKQQP